MPEQRLQRTREAYNGGVIAEDRQGRLTWRLPVPVVVSSGVYEDLKIPGYWVVNPDPSGHDDAR